MSLDKMYRLRDRLCNELDEIYDKSERGQLSQDDVHNIKMISASIHNIDEICETEQMGYSGARGRGSNANRDSMGRYSSEGSRMYPPYMGYGYSFEGRDSSNYSGNDSMERRLQDMERIVNNMQSNNPR